MVTIEIDFEVYKALTVRRETESTTYNDVIRDLLGMDRSKKTSQANANSSSIREWVCKGVRFPEGTEFRASYKGSLYRAKIEGGKLLVNGRVATSPSDAARIITNNSVNGWAFWECRFPNEDKWRSLKSLRTRTLDLLSD